MFYSGDQLNIYPETYTVAAVLSKFWSITIWFDWIIGG